MPSRRSSGKEEIIPGAKHSRKASSSVRAEMRHMKSRKHNVKNRKQAIAIGFSKARQKGAKVHARKPHKFAHSQ